MVVKEEEKAPEIVFKAEIERLMKRTLKLFVDSKPRVHLINELEKIREYVERLDGNTTKEG